MRPSVDALAFLEHRVSAIVAGVTEPPCERGCRWRHLCARERLACAQFIEYAQTGKVHQVNGDVPTRERYLSLFRE